MISWPATPKQQVQKRESTSFRSQRRNLSLSHIKTIDQRWGENLPYRLHHPFFIKATLPLIRTLSVLHTQSTRTQTPIFDLNLGALHTDMGRFLTSTLKYVRNNTRDSHVFAKTVAHYPKNRYNTLLPKKGAQKAPIFLSQKRKIR